MEGNARDEMERNEKLQWKGRLWKIMEGEEWNGIEGNKMDCNDEE